MQIPSSLRCTCGTLLCTQRKLYQFTSIKHGVARLGCKPCWTQDASAKEKVTEFTQDHKDKLMYHKASH